MAGAAMATEHAAPAAASAPAVHETVVNAAPAVHTSTSTVVVAAPAAQQHTSMAAPPAHVMSASPMAHAAAGGMTHTVTVGGLKPVETGMAPVLGYSPESIKANVGDVVKFVFMQKNHTVTQSTFADPCKKMDGGMDSGFMPNADGKAGVEWTMTVPKAEPLWFYCKQQNGFHCGKGMVFAINAAETGDKTFSVWKQLAIQKNGTAASLSTAPLASPAPNAAAKPSTVTINAGGGHMVTSVVGQASHATAAAPPAATIAQGTGKTGNGDACSCQCLCGANSFPPNVAQGNFGGFAGMLSP